MNADWQAAAIAAFAGLALAQKDMHWCQNKWSAERVRRVSYTGLTSEDAKFAIFVFSVDHSGKVSSFPASRSALHDLLACCLMGVQQHRWDERTMCDV